MRYAFSLNARVFSIVLVDICVGSGQGAFHNEILLDAFVLFVVRLQQAPLVDFCDVM